MVDVYVMKIDEINKATAETLDKLNWSELINTNDRVLIKPNISVERPKAGVTTDLTLIQSVADVLRTRTSNILVGETDSSGKNFTMAMKRLKLDCEVINLSQDKTIRVKGKYGIYDLPELALISKIVNLPVLKTHAMTSLTLGTKNLFGLIQHKDKIIYHRTIDKVLYDLITFSSHPLTS